ncbi:MAG: tRNA3(Ser)-specific nuclease WapA precursor [Verrucomicrobia bacterium ADurb.Bin118]|nr:MAG: tRNA3(Ser)-specific nuclease WapA precursor [Verrucomicrobia bacterium ADurb.Bin118]
MPKKHSRMKLLNQYTSRTAPGFVNVLGTATNTATVSLWSQDNLALYTPTTRQGDYFRGEMLFNNNTGALWLTITNVAVLSNHSGADIVTNTIGKLFVPKTAETFSYDLDGNLTFDGVWTYEWDAENRLKAMTMTNVSGIPNAQRKKLEFAYDHMNRRVQKVVKAWNGSAFANPVTTKFVYDGWNLLAVLSASTQLQSSYLWGQDLSGTLDQAGGIGGLLLVTAHGGTATNGFVAYDGNGNVTALVRGGSDPVLARYEYSAYGELLRSTGPLAVVNPFRWSSKFWDEESGLVYYGYRYYSPVMGRWFGRDPLGEQGGVNLLAFVGNNPVTAVDSDGRAMHHLGTMELYRMLPPGPSRDFIKKFTIEVTDPHFFDEPHRLYNELVKMQFENFIGSRGILMEDFSKDARYGYEFIQELSEEYTVRKSGIGSWLRQNVTGPGGRALKAAAGGIFVIAIALQVQSASGATARLQDNLASYERALSQGDQGFIDLEAISVAITTQEITGDYMSAMYVLGSLLQ